MEFSIDSVIFVTFLVLNLVAGLFIGTNIKNMREFAVGDKNFSTATLTATIIATCIGGGFFSGAITESYRQGLYFMIPAMGEPLALIVTGYFFAPRMGEFLKNISVAEAMGSLYGRNVQRISAVSAIFLCIGIVALQFKVASTILSVFFGVGSFEAVLISATVVILYSAFGGVKAVTFTDVIQFFTFGTIVPIISFIIWGTFKDPSAAITAISNNPNFSFAEVFDFSNPKFLSSVFLLIFFLMPDIQPVFFQRIAMAKNPLQARKSYMIAGLITLLLLLITEWIGVLLLSDNPSLDPNNLLAYLIEKYSYTGLKGLTAIGIMAIVMSTADSYINTASVLFSNDIMMLNSLDRKNLYLPRLVSVFVGVLAFILAFKATTILNLLIITLSFYSPIVSIPLLFAIFGFRTSTLSVLLGMFAGFITVSIFTMVDFGVDAVVPGLLANTITLFSSHYILRQKGGWVGIKDEKYLNIIRAERRRLVRLLITKIKEFRLTSLAISNKPKNDMNISFLGVFCIISIFSTMYSIPYDTKDSYSYIINIIYDSGLVLSTLFITYPIWPKSFRNDKVISFIWLIGVPYLLVVAHSILVLISNFGKFQLMIFMINQIVLALVFRWHTAIFSMAFGLFISMNLFSYIAGDLSGVDNLDLKFKVFYMLLMLSSVLIAFIKPEQEQSEITVKKVSHLESQVSDRESEMTKALDLKYDFLRNINHEFRTPVLGVTSMANHLSANWDDMSEQEKKSAASIISESSNRLSTFLQNILDFSTLSSNNYKLNKEDFNFSEFLEERIQICKDLYSDSSLDVAIEQKIKKSVVINGDKYYLGQLIDNIILNSMIHSKASSIFIELDEESVNGKLALVLSISDDGIGVPKEELDSIFIPFLTSSKTKTTAGGRGMGLTLCRRIAEVHGGKISAYSNGLKGVKFKVIFNSKA